MIIAVLAEDGRQIRAVVKGARKPGSRLGGATELYSHCELTLNRGKSLDIVTDARLLCSHRACCASLEHSAATAIIAELAEKSSREGAKDTHLLPLVIAAIKTLETASSKDLEFLVAASCLKIVAQIGFRPELEQCAICGNKILGENSGDNLEENSGGNSSNDNLGDYNHHDRNSPNNALFFSANDGGLICSECVSYAQENTVNITVNQLKLLRSSIYARFADLIQMLANQENPELLGMFLMPVATDMVVAHLNIRLKSLQFFYSQAEHMQDALK